MIKKIDRDTFILRCDECGQEERMRFPSFQAALKFAWNPDTDWTPRKEREFDNKTGKGKIVWEDVCPECNMDDYFEETGSRYYWR